MKQVVEPVAPSAAFDKRVLEANKMRRGMWVSAGSAPQRAGILTELASDGTAVVAVVREDGTTAGHKVGPVSELRQAWLEEIPASRLVHAPGLAEAMGYRRAPQ